MPQNGRGVEVLGTLALVAPKIEEFQFVKVKVEGEVARITLDRPASFNGSSPTKKPRECSEAPSRTLSREESRR